MLADHRLGIAPEENAMRENAGGLAGPSHGADDVQEIGVVALLSGRHAPGEALKAVLGGGEAGGPGLVGEGRIGDDVVVGAEIFAVLELGIEEGVSGKDVGGGEIVEDGIHAGETGGGHVLLLPFEGDVFARLGGNLEQQASRNRRWGRTR